MARVRAPSVPIIGRSTRTECYVIHSKVHSHDDKRSQSTDGARRRGVARRTTTRRDDRALDGRDDGTTLDRSSREEERPARRRVPRASRAFGARSGRLVPAAARALERRRRRVSRTRARDDERKRK